MPRHNGATNGAKHSRRQAPRPRRGHELFAVTDPAASARFRPRPLEAPSRRQLVPGAVVFGHVPFIEDDGGYKSRPVVVVELRADDRVVVRPVTGSPHPGLGAVRLTHWAAAGLKKPSSVQARTLVLDRRTELSGQIGNLSCADLAAVLTAVTVPVTARR